MHRWSWELVPDVTYLVAREVVIAEEKEEAKTKVSIIIYKIKKK